MARLALLCWEFGEGLGHVASLLQIARALKVHGWRCEFALPPGNSALRFMPRGSATQAAPEWRKALRGDFVRTGSSASMGDILADLGLRSAEGTRSQIIGWHLVFAGTLPDVVIADHAPGALLAARGRFRSIAVGTGFSVPPAGLRQFPLFHQVAPLRDDEDQIRETVNSVLEKFGGPPLANLSDALRGDAAMACTLPLLDAYEEQRSEPLFGPLLAEPIQPRDGPAGGKLVCYFQPGKFRRRLHKLAECLRDPPLPCAVFVPGLNKQEAQLLTDAGVEVATTALGTETLRHARLLIHTGGHGMACAAVLAGIPQVVLDYDIEKELTGRTLAKRGVALRLAFDTASLSEIREAIHSAANAGLMHAAARELADENAPFRVLDAAQRVAVRCSELAS